MLAALGEPAEAGLDPAPRDVVAAMAGRWAVAVAAPGLAFVSDRVPAALVEGAAPFAEPGREELPGAVRAALADHDGPVLLAAPDVPKLDRRLADAALGDLAAGCAVSFAPANDGKAYLVALRSPEPRLLDMVAGRDHRDQLLAAAIELGGEVGLLSSERRLATRGDARALAIDPLTPAELRAHVG